MLSRSYGVEFCSFCTGELCEAQVEELESQSRHGVTRIAVTEVSMERLDEPGGSPVSKAVHQVG